MTNNFVDIVGFQLEKVHTGVIGWLLDSETPSTYEEDRILILNRFLSTDFRKDNGIKITPIPEYSFGRKRRIDLVVEINKSGETNYLIIEVKTDSDVDIKQLQQSHETFMKDKPKANFSCFIITLGASQFTYQHEKIEDKEFTVLNLSQIRRIFSDLSIKGKSKIYDDWCDALKKEEEKCFAIDRNLYDMDSPWDYRLKKKGYRLGFSIFYMFYAKLREHMADSQFKNWAIYSGNNNSVMNWQDGWIDIYNDKSQLLFWEFNWNFLVLKAELDERAQNQWSSLRDKVTNLCSSSSVPGRKTATRKGTDVSIYKWEFDFCRQSITEIVKNTNKILESIHPKLKVIS